MGHFTTKKTGHFHHTPPTIADSLLWTQKMAVMRVSAITRVDCVYLKLVWTTLLEVTSYSGVHHALCFLVVCACNHLKQPERVRRNLY